MHILHFVKRFSLAVILLTVMGAQADVPMPTIVTGDGQCVEPVDDMRKNHMEYILHQRDETMHKGIRTKQHSLVECINCHVSDSPDAPRYSSEEHFCNACHSYASVRIDCFQCHADRPVAGAQQHSLSGHAGGPVETLQVLLSGENAQ